MATTGLTFKFSADMTQFRTAIDNAAVKIARFGKKMKDLGKTMSTYVTAPMTAMGAVAVANAVKYEKLATSLNVLTGSAEAGAAAFERLKTFSASTPFQLEELVSVNNQLMGFGLSADQAFNSLKMLGDVASVSGADLGRVAVAFGQSAAAGRVMTQDLNQFINNGIPIYQLLGDVTGKNVGELRELASAGQITFDILEAAFRKGTSEGGTFFQGTAKLSQTLGGRISTLTDNFNLMMGSIGQIIGEFLSPLITVTTNLFARFQSLSDTTKKWVVIIGVAVAAIGPLLLLFGSILTMAPMVATGLVAIGAAFSTINWQVVAVVAAIAAMVAAGYYLYNNWSAVTERLQLAWTKLKISMADNAIKILDSVLGVSKALGANGLSATITGMIVHLQHMDRTLPEVTTEFSSFADTLKTVKDSVLGNMEPMTEAANNLATSYGRVKTEALSMGTTVKSANDLMLASSEETLVPLTIAQRNLSDTVGETKNQFSYMGQVGMEAGQIISQAFTDANNGVKTNAEAIKTSLQGVIKSFLAAAVGALISTSLMALGPLGIAAAAAAPAIVNGLFGAIPAFADGGLVFGPTMGLVGEGSGTTRSNPEVIAPLDKLAGFMGGVSDNITVSGVLRGEDIYISNKLGGLSYANLIG